MNNYDIYSKLQFDTKRFGSATLDVGLAGHAFFRACNNFINNNLAKIEQRQKHNDDLRSFVVRNCLLNEFRPDGQRPDFGIWISDLPNDYRNMLGLIGIYNDKDGNEQTISLKRKTSKSESYVDAFTEPSDELLFWDIANIKNEENPKLLVFAPYNIPIGLNETISFDFIGIRIDYIRTIESVLKRSEIEIFPIEFDEPNLSDQNINNYKDGKSKDGKTEKKLPSGNLIVDDIDLPDEIVENLITLSTAVVSENLKSPRTPTTDYKAKEEVLME